MNLGPFLRLDVQSCSQPPRNRNVMRSLWLSDAQRSASRLLYMTKFRELGATRFATRTFFRVVEIMERQCERVFQGSRSLTRWRSHIAHRDIRRDFRWEGREAGALWSVWPLDTGDNREVRHSRTQIDPAGLPAKDESDFVEPRDDRGPRASLAYVAFET